MRGGQEKINKSTIKYLGVSVFEYSAADGTGIFTLATTKLSCSPLK